MSAPCPQQPILDEAGNVAPYLLSSIAHVIFPTLEAGRRFRDETKLINRQVQLGATKLNLWTTWAKSKEQRLRNWRTVSIAEVLQRAMSGGAQGKDLPLYQTVCWSSTTTISGAKRTCTLGRDGTEVARRVVGSKSWAKTQDEIQKAVMEMLEADL